MLRPIRKFAKRLAGQLGVYHLLLYLDRWLVRKHQAIAITYHHISGSEPTIRPLSGVQTGTSETVFEEQLSVLKNWYRPVGIDQFVSIASGSKQLQDDCFLVTFDDAYDSVKQNAQPLLERHRVPGHIFVATGYIQSEKRFWWVRVVDFMHRISPTQWKELAESTTDLPDSVSRLFREIDIDHWAQRRAASQALLAILDNSDETSKREILDALETEFESSDSTTLPVLTWQDLQQMCDQDFSIGGHTHNHPRMSQLEDQEVIDDLQLSNQRFKKEMGWQPNTFAYPTGDFDNRTAPLLDQSGYKFAFTTQSGFLTGKSEDPLHIPRICFGDRTGVDLLARIVHLKYQKLFGLKREPQNQGGDHE